jgi:putative intracellular protease/amidase
MAKKVLIVLSGYGYWGEELIGPLEALDAAGYEVDFVTPGGTRPPERPYYSAKLHVRELEQYYNQRDAAWKNQENYSVILPVGGSRPIVDMNGMVGERRG